MTRDEIIRMAIDAGLYSGNARTPGTEAMIVKRLQRFAALVAAAERKECAKVCQAVVDSGMYDGRQQYAAAACRDAIRDMNKQEKSACPPANQNSAPCFLSTAPSSPPAAACTRLALLARGQAVAIEYD